MDEPAASTTARAPAGPGGDHPGRPGEDAWASAAAAVLRKAGRLPGDAPATSAWHRLARTTVEGLVIPPLGTAVRAADLATRDAARRAPGEPPYLRGTTAASDGSAAWDVRSYLADPDPAIANRSVLADLQGGATSLWLRVGGGGTELADLPRVFGGVHLDMAPVVIGAEASDIQLAASRALAQLVRDRSTRMHPDGNLGADPIGGVARAGLFGEGIALAGGTPDRHATTVFRDLAEILALATDLGVRAIVVDGTIAHDAGAGDAAEIGYTLAAGAACLRALTETGIDIETACALIEFRYAATDEQFPTIAKLRAARFAWHRVAELSGAGPTARGQRQHAVTSRTMLSRYDPWVNLLRTTVAAFAAGVGGAAAVTVLPFDTALGVPEEFGRRMARNISALLIGESHLAAVTDPAGGAHAVELLTADLAEAAWAEFDRIEQSGGILAALADGSLAARTAAIHTERYRRIATRKQAITGVSEFPNTSEGPWQLPERRPAQQVRRARRWAEPFEMLRDRPATHPVLMITVGSPASASARTLFTRNLLAAGGITVVEPDPGATIERSLSEADCPTVILAGSDAAYQVDAASAAHRARAAGARAVFLAGRPQQLLAELPDGLIDGTVAVGDDVLDFLHTVRATLGSDDR